MNPHDVNRCKGGGQHWRSPVRSNHSTTERVGGHTTRSLPHPDPHPKFTTREGQVPKVASDGSASNCGRKQAEESGGGHIRLELG